MCKYDLDRERMCKYDLDLSLLSRLSATRGACPSLLPIALPIAVTSTRALKHFEGRLLNYDRAICARWRHPTAARFDNERRLSSKPQLHIGHSGNIKMMTRRYHAQVELQGTINTPISNTPTSALPERQYPTVSCWDE